MELDVVAICSEFTEWENIEEYNMATFQNMNTIGRYQMKPSLLTLTDSDLSHRIGDHYDAEKFIRQSAMGEPYRFMG